METACDKLQAVRSSENGGSDVFGCDVENAALDRQADANSLGTLGLLAGKCGVHAQQQLKMRLGLRNKQDLRKPLVEGHPNNGTLSDVLQESRSTQSALNVDTSGNLDQGVSLDLLFCCTIHHQTCIHPQSVLPHDHGLS